MEARKFRLKISTVVFAIVIAASMLVPALAAASGLDDLFGGGSGGGSAPASSNNSAPSGSTKAGSPPNYVPPLHGTNPHGQGTPATVELGSALDNPYTGTVTQPELLIVGRSKGEQNADGSYHGHVTLASLGGSELLGINTTPGQTASGPFDALQTQLLDAICSGSGNAICLTLLAANSATTGSGSSNSFSAATASLGPNAAPIITASALTSSGNISNDSTCQTADGHSSVADANVGGVSGLTAGLSHSNSTSQACNNGSNSTTQDSSVLELQNQGVQFPAQGCENGTPNTQFTPLNPLLSAVCNADDTTSGQTTSPYGVREALTAFVLALPGGTVLVKATTAAAESHAVAPPGGGPAPCVGANCPGGGAGGNQNNNNNGNGNNNNGGPGGGSTATNAGAGNGTLAFTGADLPWLAMLGLGLLGAGLMFAAMPGVRRPRLHA